MKELETLTDEEVIEYVRTKDQEAYLEIVQRYEKKLLRYASYLTQDKTKALDIVQNTFIKAFVNLHSFHLKKKFSSWIYRIAHNEAINEVRKDKRKVPLFKNIDLKTSETIENDLAKKEVRAMVQKCLTKIPILYSEPLSLFYLEEKSYTEISDILRIPIGTVGTRINRAKILMKKICQTLRNTI